MQSVGGTWDEDLRKVIVDEMEVPEVVSKRMGRQYDYRGDAKLLLTEFEAVLQMWHCNLETHTKGVRHESWGPSVPIVFISPVFGVDVPEDLDNLEGKDLLSSTMYMAGSHLKLGS